jgi:hypothetical protein
VDDLLGLEDLGQAVQAFVRDLDDADVEGDPAVAAGLGVAAGEGVEDGRLAAAGEPHDGDLHVVANRDTGRETPLPARSRAHGAPSTVQITSRRQDPNRLVE